MQKVRRFLLINNATLRASIDSELQTSSGGKNHYEIPKLAKGGGCYPLSCQVRLRQTYPYTSISIIIGSASGLLSIQSRLCKFNLVFSLRNLPVDSCDWFQVTSSPPSCCSNHRLSQLEWSCIVWNWGRFLPAIPY